MKTSTSMNCLRLAAMIAVTLMPGKAACTYSASANAPTLSANGGYVSSPSLPSLDAVGPSTGRTPGSRLCRPTPLGAGPCTCTLRPRAPREAQWSAFTRITSPANTR